MAKRKHVEMLRQGIEAWNQWRSQHPRIRPDLSREPMTEFEADLQELTEAVINELMPGRGPSSKLDLGGINLTQVNFRRANLAGADLSRAILVEADLSDADLRGAMCRGRIIR